MSEWDSDAALKRIEAISVNARTTWFGLLALLTFVLVTLLGVQHIDFFGYGRATQLPLVNVSVPTERFFIAAPVLVAAVYAYFHFYLMKLWDELGRAEPTIDGRPLGDLVFPWLVVDAAMLLRNDGAAPRRALARVSAFTAMLLTWLFGLIVLAYGLWQSFAAHNAFMSALNCAALLFAGWVGVTSYVVMRRRIRRRMFAPGTERVWTGWKGVLGGVFCALALIASWERATNGASRFASDLWLTGAEKKTEAEDETGDLTRNRHRAVTPWIPIAPINLAEAQLVEKPADWLDKSTAERDFRRSWCARRERAWAMCVKEPDEQQARTRKAWCAARKRNANGSLGEPHMTPDACEAYFRKQETDFQEEWEDRRAEYLSVLKKPVLEGRDLALADLRNAFLPDVDLEGARLEGGNLIGARLEGADLRWARLEGAYLFRARLEGANLGGARLEGADLGGARLEGADLGGAQFQSAEFSGATLGPSPLNSADFTGAKNLTQDMLEQAVGDADTILPVVEGDPLYVWSCWEEAPPNLEALIEMQSPWEREDRRAQWLCGPEGRKKTGRTAAP